MTGMPARVSQAWNTDRAVPDVGPLVGSARVPVCPCARGSGLCPCACVPVDRGCARVPVCPGARVPGPATSPEVQK